MEMYLGVGSNLGDRMSNLRSALDALTAQGIRIGRVSPIVESPAQLLPGADPAWNKPFLNLAVRAQTSLSPFDVLERAKRIEAELGRDVTHRWAPRPVDIDILLCGDERIDTDTLTVPHPEIRNRAFVLTPLAALNPRLRIPGLGSRNVLEISRESGHQIPLWMGIVNVTPDSFSDGGRYQAWPDAQTHIAALVGSGAQIIDLGAESTRPGAAALSADEEWLRLAHVLEPLLETHADDPLRPRFSVDTYHPAVAQRALELGADVINDVSGLTNPEMVDLAASHEAEFVAMHSLSLPADPAMTIAAAEDPLGVLDRWLSERLEAWTRAGLDPGRIVFDPGVGFGKTALQSLEILRHVGQFQSHGLRLLVGHSRKSFMRGFADDVERSRDLTTVGASMSLITQGVDILRVHNVAAHVAAWLGWAHLQAATGTHTRARSPR